MSKVKVLATEKEISFGDDYEIIKLRVHDEGAGPFLSMECINYNPTEDYNEHTVTIETETWNEIDKAIREFLKEIESER